MRAVLDTNTLISMVLTSHQPASTMWRLFQHATSGSFRAVLLEEVEYEFHRVVKTKPYLQRVIGPARADQFLNDLRNVSDVVPRIELPEWTFARDERDDFLIAYALMLNVDYLVTGDRDLLVLQGALNMIVSPAEFLALIETMTGDPK